MEVIIKVNNQSVGRDKLARLIQYTSRLVWHQLELKNANKYTIDRVRNLELSFSNFRKILRLGRCIDLFYSAFNSIHIEDPLIRITLTFSKIANALFLYADHVVWLARSGLIKADTDKWNKSANRFWLLSIIMNLVRDFYEIIKLLDLHKLTLRRPSVLVGSRNIPCSQQFKQLLFILDFHKDVFIDTLKNSCDLFIPLTALGFTKLSPSAVGALGAASSIAALVTIIKPITKLAPL